ncbi:MAG: hypothetical protein HY696_07990 [Deltaproteobacteria bacterium]|nr:hypothetical protein [Deltaproteobacteria bacterium]
MQPTLYEQLAALFDFPGPEFAAHGAVAVEAVQAAYPEAASVLQRFLAGIPSRMVDQQELYTRTFDVQATTTLDIGYILFGDDYKRAKLLAHLTREHRQQANDCRGELADHLPNLLRLLPKMPDAELRAELVSEILVPALLLMRREFDTERIEKKNAHYQKHYRTLLDTAPGEARTIYAQALDALLLVLQHDFQVAAQIERLTAWSSRPQSTDFLGLVGKEMEIETEVNPHNSGCDS